MKVFYKSTISGLAMALSVTLFPLNADAAETGSLTIALLGLESSEGQAVFVLMDSESSHTGESPVLVKKITSIQDKQAQITFEDLPIGEYSAVVYHDDNSNGKLDTYFFGLPKEVYGFSNDVRGTAGIPSFHDARFEVNSGETLHKITVK